MPQQTALRSAPASNAAGLLVDERALFPEGDGFFARRSKARRGTLLEGLARTLALALEPGEVIRYVAQGYRYAQWEYYFAGWGAYVHNRVALVATDRRLLMVHLRGKRVGHIKNQISYRAIRGAGQSFLGGWRIRLADGKAVRFLGVPRAARKQLTALLPEQSVSPLSKPATEVLSGPAIEALCPACLELVPGKVGATLTCPQPTCRIPFRDPARAARMSALVPGLGDLYLGHHFFGSAEFLGSMLMLGVGVALARDAFANGEAGGGLALALVVAIFLGIPRLIDFFLTRHIGRKGLVPLALAPAPGGQPRNLPTFPLWTVVLFVAGIALAGFVGMNVGS